MSAGLYLPSLTDGELLRHYEDPHAARAIADRLVEAEERIEELEDEIEAARDEILDALPGDASHLSLCGLVDRLLAAVDQMIDEVPDDEVTP